MSKRPEVFSQAGAGHLTCRVTGIDRADEPVLFAQLEELSLKVDNAPAGAENVPDLWLGIPAANASFQSHCQAAGLVLPDTLDREGYLLKITRQGVTLAAVDPAGVFYGLQTLRQLWRQFPGKPGLPCHEHN